MRHFRFLAAAVGMATTGALAWSVTLGATAASAASRLRSGTMDAQLVGRVTPAGTTSSAHLLVGSGVMAGIVGSLAGVALAFIVVTLVRRRVGAPMPHPTA